MKNKLNLKNNLWINLLLIFKKKKNSRKFGWKYYKWTKFFFKKVEDNFYLLWIEDKEIIQQKDNSENKYYLVNIYI